MFQNSLKAFLKVTERQIYKYHFVCANQIKVGKFLRKIQEEEKLCKSSKIICFMEAYQSFRLLT